MEEKQYDIKFLLLDKLNTIEEMCLEAAHCYEFDENDIITATRILTFIQNGSYTSSRLAKKLNISRQAIHKSITTLCEKGFLELQKDEDNKKNKIIHITKDGEELLQCRKKVMQSVEEKIEKKLGIENYVQLKKLLVSL